jgi:hypothetical protein
MQSTGQTDTHEMSLVPMQGSVMMWGMNAASFAGRGEWYAPARGAATTGGGG